MSASRPTRIPILMYHQVGPFPWSQARQHTGIYADSDRFRRAVGLLSCLGYAGVTVADVVEWHSGARPLPARSLCLTFDDAYVNVFEHAFPVLARKNWKATTYVVTAQIGGSNQWDHHKGIDPSPLMARNQIRELHDAGWEVGAHSRTHPRLPDLNDHELGAETAGSRRDLEEELGITAATWCYPYGALDERCVRAARAAGFRGGVTTEYGAAQPASDVQRLPRLGIGYRVSAVRLLWRVERARRFAGT